MHALPALLFQRQRWFAALQGRLFQFSVSHPPSVEETAESAATESASRTFTTIGVVGLGTMGAGIVEVIARNGYSVIAIDISTASVEAGRGRLEGSTARAMKRGTKRSTRA